MDDIKVVLKMQKYTKSNSKVIGEAAHAILTPLASA